MDDGRLSSSAQPACSPAQSGLRMSSQEPSGTLIEVCISDIFFAHDRGFWIGMYCWILFGIPFLGAVPAGFIAQNIGWKWIQFIASIIAAACLVAMIFFQEETMFYRPPVQEEALDVDEESASDKESTEKTASPDEKKIMA